MEADIKLSKAIDGFIFAKQADSLSNTTAYIYRWALGKLVLFLNDPEVENITTDDLRRWFQWLRNEYVPTGIRARERLSVASIQNAWKALKSFYAWGEREIQLRRVDTIRRPAGESPPIVPLTEEELRKLLRAAEYITTRETRQRPSHNQRCRMGSRNVALLLLMLDTGLRVGEVARLHCQDVNLETGEVTVMPFGTGRKTHGRIVYLGKAARKAVWKYLAERELKFRDDPLFLTESNQPLGKNTVLLLLDKIGERAGVPKVHPHKFRHIFAVHFLRNGGNIYVLQRLLGHSSLEMVKRYLALVESDAAEAMQTSSPADRWRL